MKVETTRFGTLDIDDGAVVTMPRGPLGFEHCTEFCLIQHRPDISFRWLQSTTDPALAFVVIDPSEFFADYMIEVSDSDAELLQLSKPEDALVLVVLTIGKDGKETTANLAAPVVINSVKLVGMQVILQDDRYSTRHALITQEKKVAVENASAKAA